MPKFSIIIPVYNVAPYLRECLDSVLAQTFTDWEAICVDDGSTDGSGAILDEYATKDERFRVIHQSNAGVSAARNAALKRVLGEWIWFVDSDDVVPCDALEKMSAISQRVAGDAFYFDEIEEFVDSPPRVCSGDGKIMFANAKVTDAFRVLFWKPQWVSGHPVKRLLRAKLFRGVEFPIGVAMMEDDIHFVRCLALPARWIVIDLICYGYRVRSASASRIYNAGKTLEVLNSALASLDAFGKIPSVPQDLMQEYARRWGSNLEVYLSIVVRYSSNRMCIRETRRRWAQFEQRAGCRIVCFGLRIKFLLLHIFGWRIGRAMIVMLCGVKLLWRRVAAFVSHVSWGMLFYRKMRRLRFVFC